MYLDYVGSARNRVVGTSLRFSAAQNKNVRRIVRQRNWDIGHRQSEQVLDQRTKSAVAVLEQGEQNPRYLGIRDWKPPLI